MLLEFRVANYRSIRKAQTLSMMASIDKSLPDNLIQTEKYNLLKVATLFGANASGKSNFIKALQFMDRFVERSAIATEPDQKIDVEPFALNSETINQPSSFEVTFIHQECRYQYGFSATVDRVMSEWLFAFPSGKQQTWFTRNYVPAEKKTMWTFPNDHFGSADQKLLQEKTRDNCLVLSRGADLNINDLRLIYDWFKLRMSIFDFSTNDFLRTMLDRVALNIKYDEESYRKYIVSLLHDADFGIENLEVVERPIIEKLIKTDLESLSSDVLSELRSQVNKGLFEIRSIHRIEDTKELHDFSFENMESHGTKRFCALAGRIINVLKHGYTMVIDEFDCSIHPLLVRKLVALFQSPDINKNSAQLIFTSHDSSLFDLKLLRRDQILLVNKSQQHDSSIYSLFDIEEDKPRANEAVGKNYLSGRYGGVPSFGRIFEDLELPQ